MIRKNQPIRRPAVAASMLFIFLAAAGAAAADPTCQAIHGRIAIAVSTEPCDSAIALCATAMVRGALNADTEFVGTSSVVTVDTATTGVVVLTGDNLFHAKDGDIFTKDAIVLSTVGDGEFAEIDTIVGGTGAYEGATGYLQAVGTFTAGAGAGTYTGKLCTP